ncbi:MAG: hypothetical protein SCARUB_01572 [Candidatus Scalindua rubra]|uniref:Uncharacterized protein n=1 Tax=Candidatus Scalindua rubra TaxID=1872076 RepID=A0A1E3XCD6_9BACT|nr:MAG: hypothetical protein SCARUB_01572 [Candidatus Scalindua rubra]
MSKIKIIILSLFLLTVFSFPCEITFAGSRKDNENGTLLYNSPKTYVNFCTGFYLMREHRWEEAIVFFKKVLQSDPNAERIHNFLATCYFQSNNKEEALFHIEKIAQLKPDDFNIHYTLGNIYESKGNGKRAISEYESANSSVMDGIDKVFVSDMLLRLANLYLKNGDLENATNVYKKILDLELTRESVKIHYKLGQIYFERKKIEEAIEEFVKARDSDPKYGSVSYYLALCYEELEDYDRAIAELKSFVENDSESWHVRIGLSNIYDKVKQYEMAELERDKVFDILIGSVNNGSKNLREYIVLSQLLQKRGKNKKGY